MAGVGTWLVRLGGYLAIAGGALFTGIFLIVILNGSWPGFLEPVRSRYQLISSVAGGFAFVIEIGLFVGPGLIISALGEKIKTQTATTPGSKRS